MVFLEMKAMIGNNFCVSLTFNKAVAHNLLA